MGVTYLGSEQITDIIAKNPGKTYRSFNMGSLLYLLGSWQESDLLFVLRNELAIRAKVALHIRDGKKVAGGIGYLELQENEVRDFEGKDTIERHGYVELTDTRYVFAGLIKPGSLEGLRALDGCRTTTEDKIYTSVGLTKAERNRLIEMISQCSEKVVDIFFEEAPGHAKEELERIEKIPRIARQVDDDVSISMAGLDDLEMPCPGNSPEGRTVMKRLPEHGHFMLDSKSEPCNAVNPTASTRKTLGMYFVYR